jgi:hypothetical protein
MPASLGSRRRRDRWGKGALNALPGKTCIYFSFFGAQVNHLLVTLLPPGAW